MRLPRVQFSIRRLMVVIFLLAVGLAFLGRALISARSVEYEGDSQLMLIEQAEAFSVCGIPALACFGLAGATCLCRFKVSKSRALNITIVTLALFSGYTAAYFMMVRPSNTFFWIQPYPNFPQPQSIPLPAEYRCGGRFASVLFGPIHGLDRFLRPSVWAIPIPPMS